MCSLERIPATPSCPIKLILEHPLTLGNAVNINYADHSTLKVNGKTVYLADLPFALVIDKPPPISC